MRTDDGQASSLRAPAGFIGSIYGISDDGEQESFHTLRHRERFDDMVSAVTCARVSVQEYGREFQAVIIVERGGKVVLLAPEDWR